MKIFNGAINLKNKIAPEIFFLVSLAAFFVVFSHYLQINRSGVGLELPFNAMGWIPVAFAIGAGLFVVSGRKIFVCTDLSIKLMVLVCLLIAPIFLPVSNQDAVLDRMLGLLAGLLMLFSLQQFPFSQDRKILLLLLVIIAVWVEMILGWDRFMRSLGYWISGSRPAWEGDPHGVFQQRNVFASFIATGIVLSAYLLGYASKIHEKSFQSYHPVLLLMPLAGIHLMNAMYSRTGWFGLALGVVLVMPYMLKYAARHVSVLWLLSLAGGFLLTMWLGQSTAWDAPERTIASIEGLRQVHFPQTVRMILEKPVFGYGYGTFESAYLNFTAQQFATGASTLPGVSRLDHPHNELLFWAAEGGIYALIIVLAAAWFVWRRVLALPLIHRLAVIGLFFPIVFHSQLEYPFYQSAMHWMIFVMFIYWVDQLTAKPRQMEIRSVLLVRIGSILIPVVTTIFMVTTLHTGYLLSRFESDIDPNVESLSGIRNPVAYQDRINWAIMSRLVLAGAINNRPEYVQPFIEWAPDLIARKPRPNFYRFLILAYKVAGDEENMQKIQQEAEFLFPDLTFETPAIEGGLATPVPFDAVSR